MAVPIAEHVIAELAKVQRELQRLLVHASWTRPEAMHLTLHFLGNVDVSTLEELKGSFAAAVRPFPALALELSGIGSFGNRVVWAGVAGDVEPLHELARSVRDAVAIFGTNDETRPFSAHVTLARLRIPHRGLARELAPFAARRLGAWTADRVELIRSELSPCGSRYTMLAQAGLERLPKVNSK